MSFIVKAKEAFEIAPEGLYPARIEQMIDLGVHKDPFNEGKDKRLVKIRFELSGEQMSDGRPFTISKDYPVSLHEKAGLRKVIKAALGRDLTADELKKGFDIFCILSNPVTLNIVHEKGKEDRVYAKIDSVSVAKKNMPCPELVNPPVMFHIDNFDAVVFNSLHEKTREKINLPPGIDMTPKAKQVNDDTDPAELL